MRLVSTADHSTTYRIGILGPTVLSRNNDPIDMKGWGKRPPSLLRLLATSQEGRRPRDEIADLLWPDSAPDAALTNLRGVIHRLRLAAEPGPAPVVLDGGWVRLNPGCSWEVDLVQFDELAGSNDLPSLEKAALLVRGEPLVDDRYEDWAAPIRDRIERQWKAICLRLVNAYRSDRMDERACVWAERLLSHDPCDEAAMHQLLLVLDTLGRRHEAVERFRAFEGQLLAELDVPVAGETKALALQIEQREHAAREQAPTLQTRGPLQLVVLHPSPTDSASSEPAAFVPAGRQTRSRTRIFLAGLPVLAAVVIASLAFKVQSGSGGAAHASRAAFTAVLGWGEHPTTVLSFKSPGAMALDVHGNLYVSDQLAGRIDEISPTGVLLGAITLPAGQTFLPGPIAIDRLGNVYAVDSGNASIRRFTSEGVLNLTYPVSQVDPGGTAPAGLGIDQSGRTYILLQTQGVNNVAVVPSSTGNGPLTQSKRAFTLSSFASPLALTVSPDGKIYVLNGGQFPGVDQFNLAGDLVRAYGAPLLVIRAIDQAGGEVGLSLATSRDGAVFLAVGGSADHRAAAALYRLLPHAPRGTSWWASVHLPHDLITSPADVVLDDQGNLLVSDATGKRIVKLTEDGRLLAIWGVGQKSASTFNAPTGVALDGEGHVFVANAATNEVVKLSQDGKVLAHWGGAGSSTIRLSQPQGIALDGNGDLYVADMGNNRIVKLAPNGTPVAPWGERNNTTSNLNAPSSIAVDRHGNVWTLDTSVGSIREFSAGAKPLSTWPLKTGDGGDYYGGVGVDAAGNVYVTDGLDSGVTKYTSSGTPLHSWGALGVGPREFRAPANITLDRHGNMYIADTGNGRIQELSPSGAVLHVFDVPGIRAGEFGSPVGIAVDTTGNVYVTDTQSNRLDKLVPG